MEWKNKPTEWKNEGTPPSPDLVDMGFVGGYKPPASVFNHFFSTHQKLLDEVQENVDLLQAETQTETADIRNTVQANVDELKATIGSNTEAFEAALEEQLTNVTADIESKYNELNTGKADKTQTEASINTINGNITTINTNMDTKVDKVEGKGLSTNDFTNADKAKTDLVKTDLASDVFLAGDGTYKEIDVSVETLANKLDKTDGGTVTGAVNFTGGLTKNGAEVPTLDSTGKIPISNIPTGTTGTTVSTGSHTHNYAASPSVGGNATTANKTVGALTVSLNGSSQGAFNGSAAKSINVTAASVGAAESSHTHAYSPTSHTHNYAASPSAGGNAIAANKTAGALTVQLNGTSQGAFNGAANKTINVTAASVGAAASSHTHSNYATTHSHPYAATNHGGNNHNYLYAVGGTSNSAPNSLCVAKEKWFGFYSNLTIYGGMTINSTGDLFIKSWDYAGDCIIQAMSLKVNSNGPWRPVYASAFSVQSSRRFKENIKDISLDEANKIYEINPVKFDYINGEKNAAGVIAEEVEPLFPNVCSYSKDNPEDEEEQLFGVDYSKFVPYLIKIVQEQKKEIDELRAEVKSLK